MPAQSARTQSSPGSRRGRPAVWPWLVMPLVVLVVFYVLYQLRHSPQPAPASSGSESAEVSGTPPAGERTTAPADGAPR